jgi:hypothetical protein
MREARWEHTAARTRCPIPDDPQVTRAFPTQRRPHGHDIGRVERPCVAVNRPLPLWGDGPAGREVGTRPPLPEHGGGGLPGPGGGRPGAGDQTQRHRLRRWVAPGRVPRCARRPGLLPPGFVRAPSDGVAEAADRARGVGEAKRQAKHSGAPATGPDRPAKAIRFGAAVIGRGDQPCWVRCQAWQRRASFPVVGVRFMPGVSHMTSRGFVFYAQLSKRLTRLWPLGNGAVL